MTNNETVLTVPDVTLKMTGDQTINLTALKGKNIVLYFYPKDMTPGCTTEAKDFTADIQAFSKHNTIVLGVSRDNIAKHEKFKSKYDMALNLISDPDDQLGKHFKVISEKSLFGKTFLGVQRSTFLIDENGTVIQEWRKVKVKGHVAEVLQAVQNISTSLL